MIDALLDSLPLSGLPKVPAWQARTQAEGNAVVEMLRSLHAPMLEQIAHLTAANPHIGFSISARRRVSFTTRSNPAGAIDFRESIECPITHLNARARAAYHLFLTLCEQPESCDVYLTEQKTPLFDLLSRQTGTIVGSEYLPEVDPGARDRFGVRCEDLTALTFADGCFDAVISLDVLEHVPDFRAALAECARVLRPGGRLILTAPFAWTPKHVVRARVTDDGGIEHLLPPDYHGDPIRAEGILCYYWFGWELLDDLKAAGFSDAHVALVSAPEFGYLGEPLSHFVATR